MSSFSIRNPYTGDILDTRSYAKDSEIEKKLQKLDESSHFLKNQSAHFRSQILKSASQKLSEQKEKFAQKICEEAGKPITLARGEVDRGIQVLDWASSEVLRFSGELLRLDVSSAHENKSQGFGIHRKFPRGLVLGITPFNFPLNLVLHKVAPAIATGCPILIKPSPETPLVAEMIQILFPKDAGLDVVLADDEHTAKLTQDSRVKTISFTGSARVGWMIRKQASEKSTVLELGGNAWAILLEDTDPSLLPKIAGKLTQAAFGYAGQSCISVQNIAVAKKLWKPFQEAIQKAISQTPYGDPKNDKVLSGPLIRPEATTRVKDLLKGHSFISSKTPIDPTESILAPSAIECPTLNQVDSSPLTQEEIFGPVFTYRPFETLEAVIQQVNTSRYGLQTGVFTQNWGSIEKLYSELNVGGVVINDVPTTRYDHQPYGGVKDSGIGREGLRYAMEEITESKFLALSSQV